MPIQNYKLYTANAYRGQIAYSSENHTVVSGSNESVDLNFGVALKRGVAADGFVKGHAAGNVFGIAKREINHEAANRPSDGTTYYQVTETISILRQGTINLEVTSVAAVRDAKVNVVNTTGEFSGGAPGAGETQSVNVTWLEDGLVGDIIKARIDIVA